MRVRRYILLPVKVLTKICMLKFNVKKLRLPKKKEREEREKGRKNFDCASRRENFFQLENCLRVQVIQILLIHIVGLGLSE